jgi:AraC-like DNA-binding protein
MSNANPNWEREPLEEAPLARRSLRSAKLHSCSAEQFRRHADGTYVVGGNWLCFGATGLIGAVLWGTPGVSDGRSLIDLFGAWLRRETLPRSVLLDVSKASVPLAEAAVALQAFHVYVAEHRSALSRIVSRFALVHAEDVTGLVARGLLREARMPHPLESFSQMAAALAWLGQPQPEHFAAELAALRSSIDGASPTVQRLESVLRHGLRDITVRAAARSIGVSVRTLQRQLRESATTFGRELNRQRVEAAQRLLVDTNASVTEIAFHVGCASPAHLSVLFKKQKGQSPSRFRAQYRRRLT